MKKLKFMIFLLCIIISMLIYDHYLSYLNKAKLGNASVMQTTSEQSMIAKQDKSKRVQLKKDIELYLGSNLEHISIIYQNLSTDEGFDINGDVQYYSASLAKLFVAMYGYKELYEKHLSSDTLIAYHPEFDYEAGSGILQNEDLRKPIKISRLLDVMIRYSDNIAYRMLLRYFNPSDVLQFYESIIGHKTSHDVIRMSAKDAQKLMIKIYQNPIYRHLRNALKNSIYQDRIAAYLPSGIVEHKIGDFETYVHDAAIVNDEQPYLLIMLSNKLEDAHEKEAYISKIIYEGRKKDSTE